MAIWPHEETPLMEHEKAAYRRLLYWAMLDIRTLCQSRGPESRNPLEWRRQYRLSRVAGAIADWLHNLATYAASDFRGFDTEEFWREYDGVCKRFRKLHPASGFDYRRIYDDELVRQKKSK